MAVLPDIPDLTVDTAGGGGGTAETGTIELRRRLAHIALTYNGSFNVAGTVTINYKVNGASKTLMVVTGNSDIIVTPSVALQDAAGADRSGAGVYVQPTIWGTIELVVAGAGGALTPAVTARFVMAP